MMKIANLGLLIEEAMELEQTLECIYQMEISDESAKALDKIRALLGTDSTTHNIEAIVKYVNENKKWISIKYNEVCD